MLEITSHSNGTQPYHLVSRVVALAALNCSVKPVWINLNSCAKARPRKSYDYPREFESNQHVQLRRLSCQAINCVIEVRQTRLAPPRLVKTRADFLHAPPHSPTTTSTSSPPDLETRSDDIDLPQFHSFTPSFFFSFFRIYRVHHPKYYGHMHGPPASTD